MRKVEPMKAWLAVVVVLALSGFAPAIPQQESAQPNWTPPAPRKVKTPFAPKPLKGDNIFKGEAEIWLADALEKVEGGIFTSIEDKAVNDYVSQVGTYIASHSTAPTKQYKFVVTTDSTPDAMTPGGGRIYVSVGMLEQVESEDELAGILAHEIAHDAFRHVSKTVTRQMFWMTGERNLKSSAEVESAVAKLLAEYAKKPIAAIGESLLGFARFDELEADRAAFYNTYEAGYDPAALSKTFKRMASEQKEEMGKENYRWHQFLVFLLGTHPPSAQRSLALKWESNFVRMPAKDSSRKSSAFDAMKLRIAKLSKQV